MYFFKIIQLFFCSEEDYPDFTFTDTDSLETTFSPGSPEEFPTLVQSPCPVDLTYHKADSPESLKKSSKSLPESEMRRRRLAANARERRRMDLLNRGFDRLRRVLPGLGPQHQLSKYETLQMAQSYIAELAGLLKQLENMRINQFWLNLNRLCHLPRIQSKNMKTEKN